MSKPPTKPKAPRKQSVLTQKQETYVNARLDGKSKAQAAREAGYEGSSVMIEKSEDLKQALAAARSELSDAAQIKRVDVIAMFQEAYGMAKLAGEPASMVSAAKEIGKMLGLYEPETIKLALDQGQSSLQRKLLTLSDAELLEIANGQGQVIDGEFTRVQ